MASPSSKFISVNTAMMSVREAEIAIFQEANFETEDGFCAWVLKDGHEDPVGRQAPRDHDPTHCLLCNTGLHHHCERLEMRFCECRRANHEPS